LSPLIFLNGLYTNGRKKTETEVFMNEEFFIPDEEMPDEEEFDPTFLEEDQEFPDDEDAQETDWSFKHGQY